MERDYEVKRGEGEVAHALASDEHYPNARVCMASVEQGTFDFLRLVAENDETFWNPAEADKAAPVRDVTYLYHGPRCGHAACSQHYIDTGSEECVL